MSLRIAIIEDEPATARHLGRMLRDIAPDTEVLATLTSVAEASVWLKENMYQCDLLFMDIRLSDGLSFEIFNKLNVTLPVIFITAYDDYALQAFRANGIDYILKPFDSGELERALDKFKRLSQRIPVAELMKIVAGTTAYKRSFLVHSRDKLIPLSVEEIAWFYTANELVYAGTQDNREFIIDLTLEQLQQQLDPHYFFRANRQFILHRKAIREIDFYFNGRLAVQVLPAPKEQILVSKAKAPEFKQWMNS